MISLLSPAKINLFLQVVGLRSDGYHDLLTKMQTVSLFDTLQFKSSTSTDLKCTDSTIPVDGTNLILQAHALFEKKIGNRCPVKIHLNKKIPHQAGLGGGSSNAATTLFALNQLFSHPFSVSQLAEMSQEIGSDVPFFFSSGSAVCSGRGEKVQSLPTLQNQKVTIVKPKFGLKTSEVYQAYNTSCKHSSPYFNDLEQAAFFIAPELKKIKEVLAAGGFLNVLLSGSGSSFFCLGEGTISPELPIDIFRASFCSNGPNWYTDR